MPGLLPSFFCFSPPTILARPLLLLAFVLQLTLTVHVMISYYILGFRNFRRHLTLCILQGASGAEMKASCTEAGMFALRERRIHVTQEDFEMAVAKVMKKDSDKNMSLKKLWK